MAEKINALNIDGVTYPLEDKDAIQSIKVGTTTTGGPDSAASVVNSGTDQDVVLDFTLPQGPQGDKGDKGDAATIAVDTVYTGRPGTAATVTNIGTSSDAVLSFTIPQGEQGEQGEKGDQGEQGEVGPGATVKIGAVITGAAGTAANVTNVGTDTAAVFNFTIPKGDKGDSGTIEIGEVITGETGEAAAVTNVGTKSAAIFDFVIPRGDKGETGDAATITVGTVTTGSPGTNASVHNSGDEHNAIFDFTIPQGLNETMWESIVDVPFAFYSADDNSLNFCSDAIAPTVGEEYDNKIVTNVYTDFIDTEFTASTSNNGRTSNAPWDDVAESVKEVYIDESFAKIKPKYLDYWFFYFTSCTYMSLQNLDTSEVVSMDGTFRNCTSLTSIDLSKFITDKVTDMAQMFYLSGLIELDVESFDTTNATTMNGMFREMPNLVTLDIAHFDTSKVEAMNAMFRDSPNLTTIYSEDFDTSSMTNDANMFLNCTNLVGGNGTVYDATKVNSGMAHIDTDGNPGYFTAL